MSKKQKIAIVRGKYLNPYEMQFYQPLVSQFDVTAFGSLYPYGDKFAFPVVKLPSPMDLPEFPFKMPILNRMFIDAHVLFGLENRLRGFDLVHTAESYYFFTYQCLRAKKMGYVKKVVATVLENIPHNNEGILGRKYLKNNAYKYLDHILALTNLTKQALIIEGVCEDKITVLPHFIDTNNFKQKSNTKKTNLIDLLFVGRLEMYKGIMDLLQSFLLLYKDPELKDYRITLRIVGDGSLKHVIFQFIKQHQLFKCITLDQISYDHMPTAYANADIFIAPSKPTKTWTEQYCTALLEAQASGLAIVTTRTGGIVENVGDAALLTEPGNILGITHLIKKFIIDQKLRIEYGIRARQRALAVHDIKIGSSKLAAIYHQLLDV